MPIDTRLRDQVLDALAFFEQRATYGAVAHLIGGIPQGAMRGLPRTPRNSWVVNAESGLPTGYLFHERASSLEKHDHVISDGAELWTLVERALDAAAPPTPDGVTTTQLDQRPASVASGPLAALLGVLGALVGSLLGLVDAVRQRAPRTTAAHASSRAALDVRST